MKIKHDKMTIIRLIVFLTLFSGCDNNESVKNVSSNKLGLDTTADTYSVTGDDASMNAAIDKARKMIAAFDQALKSNNPSFTDFAVKKRYKTADDGGEHMWIGGIKIIDENYIGLVNNNAEKTTEVKYGDTVIVGRDEITDWMYLEHNNLRGGFTIREVRNKLNKEERIKMDRT